MTGEEILSPTGENGMTWVAGRGGWSRTGAGVGGGVVGWFLRYGYGGWVDGEV